MAGRGLVPEAVVVDAAFRLRDDLAAPGGDRDHPAEPASRRVVEKLGIREEGVALRFLEIDGVWEDHVRYAITAEEWAVREPRPRDGVDRPAEPQESVVPMTDGEWRKNCSTSCS